MARMMMKEFCISSASMALFGRERKSNGRESRALLSDNCAK